MSYSRSSRALAAGFVATFLVLFPVLSCPGGIGVAVRNGDEHAGHAVACDLPPELRVRNTVGTNNMGLCVWASLQMDANYLNAEELAGLFEYMKTQPGGGWPERVDEMMARHAPGVRCVQYQGSGLEFIEKGLRSGRPVCVTYGYGELYGNVTIAHMVLCVALDSERAAILDNNDPGHIWWMPRAEFKRRFGWPTGRGWAVYLLSPPPPPAPHN